MDQGKKQPPGSCPVCFFLFRSSQIIGDHSVDPHAETDGDSVDKVLDRVDQGQSCHGVFADLCYKKAVYDIVQRIYQHGDHHRKSHRHDQWKYGLFFHKSFIHLSITPFIMVFADGLRAKEKPHNHRQ